MRKKLIIIIVILALLISGLAVGLYLHAQPRFPEGTTLCSTDVSGKFMWTSASRIEDTLEAYSITVSIGAETRTFSAQELSLALDEVAMEQLAADMQQGLTDIDNSYVLTMDTTPVKDWVYANIAENRIEPVGAHLVWNAALGQFELKGSVVGEYDDAGLAFQVVVDSLYRMESTVTLTEATYHVEYTIPEQLAAEQEALAYANELVSRELSYLYYLRTEEYAEEVITPEMIADWLIVGKDGLSLTWDEKTILHYAESMSETYSLQGGGYFLSHDDREINLPATIPANLVDTQALYKDILTSLANMESGQRSVPYTEQNKFRNFDGTYIEVCIGQQKLFAYLNGELFAETGIVTGCMHCDHGTVTGVFDVKNRSRNIYLQNGTDYFVRYWMGFLTPKYGLHDADGWRKPEEYGSDIYLRNGSGGCVNVPREVIGQMIEVFEVGTPVIIYDESYVITGDTTDAPVAE